MADDSNFKVEVDGLRELSRGLRKLGDKELKAELNKANRKLANEIASRARPNIPVRTGALVRTLRTTGFGEVKLGNDGKVDYLNYSPGPGYWEGMVKGTAWRINQAMDQARNAWLHQAAHDILSGENNRAVKEYEATIKRIARQAGFEVTDE